MDAATADMNLNGLTLISLANVKNAEVQKLDVYLSGGNMTGREMDELERHVFNYINNNGTFEKPAQSIDIRKDYNLSERKLKMIVESLRVNFGHPIVAFKTKPYGYYMPKNEEERQAGLAPYRRQILTEQKNLATVMAVDLKEYWSA